MRRFLLIVCASKGVWKCGDEQAVSRRLHRWDLRQCTFPTRTSLDIGTTAPPHEHSTVDPQGRALRRILRYDLWYVTESSRREFTMTMTVLSRVLFYLLTRFVFLSMGVVLVPTRVLRVRVHAFTQRIILIHILLQSATIAHRFYAAWVPHV